MPSESPTVLTPCHYSWHLFFSPDLIDQERAKELCQGCIYRRPCLQRAITENHTDGIWGGFDEVERRLWVRFNGEVVGPAIPELPEIIVRQLRANKVMKTGPDANLDAIEA